MELLISPRKQAMVKIITNTNIMTLDIFIWNGRGEDRIQVAKEVYNIAPTNENKKSLILKAIMVIKREFSSVRFVTFDVDDDIMDGDFGLFSLFLDD